MIKLLIFDFDGVIVESVDLKTAAFADLFKEEGQDAVREILKYHQLNMGLSRYEKFKFIYKNILKRELRKNEFIRLCTEFSVLVKDKVINSPFVKGSLEFLKDNSLKYKMFIVSATPQKEIEEIVSKRKISSFFSGIYGAPAKKTETVSLILSEHSVYPKQAVYVGDALSDYEAAIKNGVYFLARIYHNKDIFNGINCPKISDLESLNVTLDKIGVKDGSI